MKVKELIEELKKYNAENVVLLADWEEIKVVGVDENIFITDLKSFEEEE